MAELNVQGRWHPPYIQRKSLEWGAGCGASECSGASAKSVWCIVGLMGRCTPLAPSAASAGPIVALMAWWCTPSMAAMPYYKGREVSLCNATRTAPSTTTLGIRASVGEALRVADRVDSSRSSTSVNSRLGSSSRLMLLQEKKNKERKKEREDQEQNRKRKKTQALTGASSRQCP